MTQKSYFELNDMAVFAIVVKQGGFSAAARTLGLPKSNISRRVARLEEHLSVRLLERTTRKIGLTEIGELYFRHCVRILEEAQEAQLAINKMQEVPRGLLRVSASVTMGQALLGPLLPDFMNRYPEVQVQLLLTNRRVDLIEEGFDLVIRIGRLEDSSLIMRGLGQSCLLLYASPDYLSRRDQPRTVEELLNHDCLVMSDREMATQWKLVGPTESKTVTISPRAIANDFATLRSIALAGLGITLLPTYLCRDDEEQGRLVPVLPEWSLPPVPVQALYPSHRGVTPKVRAFLDFLVEKLAPQLRL